MRAHVCPFLTRMFSSQSTSAITPDVLDPIVTLAVGSRRPAASIVLGAAGTPGRRAPWIAVLTGGNNQRAATTAAPPRRPRAIAPDRFRDPGEGSEGAALAGSTARIS